MAVRRDRGHSMVHAVFGCAVLDLVPVEDDLAAAFLEVVDRLHELMLAVAVDAGDTDDLARMDLQAEVPDRIDPLLVLHIQVLDIQHDLLRLRGRLFDDQLDRVADHHGRQVVLRDALDRHRVDVVAAADDRADVGGCLNLLELVRDDDDRLAVRDQVFHDPEQLVDLLLRQDRRRLVQDQDLRPAVQGLQDLYTLLHADRNIADQLVRLHFQAVPFDDLHDILPGLFHIEADACRGGLGTQDDVLRDRKILHQHKVLVHHADAMLDGRGRILDIHFFAVDEDLPFFRLVQAVKDIHQRALAGAVLTEDGMDRPLFHIEIDVGQRIEGTKALGDPMHLHSISAADFCAHVYSFLSCETPGNPRIPTSVLPYTHPAPPSSRAGRSCLV